MEETKHPGINFVRKLVDHFYVQGPLGCVFFNEITISGIPDHSHGIVQVSQGYRVIYIGIEKNKGLYE